MILTKIVDLKMFSRNIQKYRELGYIVNIGDIIKVDISELPKGSHSIIESECDICKIVNQIKYQDYIKITRNEELIYCCFKCRDTKSKITCIQKYGVDSYAKTEKSKENYKSVCLSKYGVDNISKLESIKLKKYETTLSNYGVGIPAKSDIVLKKMQETCIEKYGFTNYVYIDAYKEKNKNTLIEKYGVDNVFKSEIIKNKIKKSMIDKYGSDHPMRVESIFYKQMISAKSVKEYNGLYYQGTYELDFIKVCEQNNIIIEKGPIIKYDNDRKYFPDFFIKNKNIIIEIKSSYTYIYDIEKNIMKMDACISQGYQFIFIIDKKYEEFFNLLAI